MANEGGDNYAGGWNIDPDTESWMGANAGTPTWDPSGNWDMGQSWWQRNTPSPETMTQINALRGGLSSLKPMADPNAAAVARQFPAIPSAGPAGIHQGQGADLLSQYLQMMQQRQQAARTQFMPKTAGLLGG